MRVAVTGGGGFLGRRVVELLADAGHTVRVVGRSRYADLEQRGLDCVQADLSDRAQALRALEGVEAVVHCAAKAGVWGPREEYERANVDATRHVLEAARTHGIARLVHTSSPSVCFDGRDHVRVAEAPYPARYLAAYPATKAAAERLVLAANDARLATVALRPHLIFGPGDPHLVPRLIDRAAAGKLAVVGSGTNRVSLTYVDDAAWAHVDALGALAPGAACAGRAYFVANAEDVVLWDWVRDLLRHVGVPAPRRRVPLPVAYAAGAAAEAVWRATARSGEPPMTRFVALQLARTHTYDVAPLERDLGHRERFGVRAGTERLFAEWAGYTARR